jgi:hypothetical protein
LYTTPIPPRPNSATTSYDPSVAPTRESKLATAMPPSFRYQ